MTFLEDARCIGQAQSGRIKGFLLHWTFHCTQRYSESLTTDYPFLMILHRPAALILNPIPYPSSTTPLQTSHAIFAPVIG